jgi:hypothetical protein
VGSRYFARTIRAWDRGKDVTCAGRVEFRAFRPMKALLDGYSRIGEGSACGLSIGGIARTLIG